MTEDQRIWIKAAQSMATGACVELATHDGWVNLRNSRDPDVVLRFTPAEMRAFVAGLTGGEFDHLFN